MAIQTHTIHGTEYLYDHHRVNGKVVSTYLGRKDDISTQRKIEARGFPITSKDYPEAHKEADKEELKEYGKERWDRVEEIAENLPKDELAGSHNGKIVVSDKVPENYRGQVLYHEMKEKELMEGSGAKPMNRAERKFGVVMREYGKGRLFSSHGKKVKTIEQAQAIAFSEARKVNPEYGK